MILKKGNQVKIITGKDKGKTGEILEINRKLNKINLHSPKISDHTSIIAKEKNGNEMNLTYDQIQTANVIVEF